jgi:hypothetical protein
LPMMTTDERAEHARESAHEGRAQSPITPAC